MICAIIDFSFEIDNVIPCYDSILSSAIYTLFDSGIKFNNTVVGGNIPKEYIPGVEKGIKSASQNGVIAGYNVIDFEAEVYDALIMTLTHPF